MHGRTKRSTQQAGSNNTTAVKPPEIHQKKYFFFPAEVVRCPAPPRASACPFSHACSEIRVIGAPAQAQALQLSSAPAPSAAQPQPGTGPCFPPCCCREGWGLTVTPGLWLHASTQNSGCRWVSKLCFSEVLGGYIKQNKTQQYLSS